MFSVYVAHCPSSPTIDLSAINGPELSLCHGPFLRHLGPHVICPLGCPYAMSPHVHILYHSTIPTHITSHFRGFLMFFMRFSFCNVRQPYQSDFSPFPLQFFPSIPSAWPFPPSTLHPLLRPLFSSQVCYVASFLEEENHRCSVYYLNGERHRQDQIQ